VYFVLQKRERTGRVTELEDRSCQLPDKARGMSKQVRGDIFGGLTASVIALPLAIAFGVLAFSPLGPEYRSAGALAGLYGAIFSGFFAAVFGGTPSQVTGQRAR